MSRLMTPMRLWTKNHQSLRLLSCIPSRQSRARTRLSSQPIQLQPSVCFASYFQTSNVNEPYLTDRERLLSQMESNLGVDRKISLAKLNQFIEEMEKVPSLKSMESILLIRSCGVYLVDASSEERLQVVDRVWKLLKEKNAPLDTSHYNALLNIYNEVGHSIDPMEFLEMMKSDGIEPNRVTYQRLIHRYCLMGRPEGAQKVLEIMKSLDYSINESVFNSLILGNLKASRFENAESTVKLMRNHGIEPSAETYKALFVGYAEHSDKQEVEKRMLELIEEMSKDDISLAPFEFIDIVATIGKKNENSVLVDKIINILDQSKGYNLFVYRTIIKLINNGVVDLSYKLLRTMENKETDELHGTHGSFLIYYMVRFGIPMEKVIKICEELESKKLNEWTYSKAAEAALYTGDKETALKYLDLFEQKTGISRPHLVWPRICFCQNDEELLQVLRDKLLSQALINPRSVHETFTDYVWPRVQGNKVSFMRSCEKIGFSMKTMAPSLPVIFGKDPKVLRESDIFDIVTEISEDPESDPQTTKNLALILCEIHGVYVTQQLLKPIIAKIIKSASKDEAVKEWIECVGKHKAYLCKSLIMERLIREDDVKGLQQIIDMCIQGVGERETLANLALAFLKCSKEKQARRIFTRPGLFIPETTLERMAESLIKNEEIETLERLVTATKGLSQINRERQYRLLLEGYIHRNDVDKAVEMWTSMQDEDIVPSPQILSRLANFLKTNNRAIPFEYKDEIMEMERTDAINSLKQDMYKAIKEEKLDEAFRLKEEIKSMGCDLTLGEECTLIEQVLKKGLIDYATKMTTKLMENGRFPPPRIYQLLFQQMVSKGMTPELNKIIEFLPSALKQATWFANLVIRAHEKSDINDFEHFLMILPEFRPLPVSALLSLLNSRPECEQAIFNVLEGIAKREETCLPQNIIWIHLMKKARYEEAQKVFRSTQFQENLMIKPLLDEIRRGNMELGYKLIEQLNERQINPTSKATVYDIMINHLLKQEKVLEAEDLFVSGLSATKNLKTPLVKYFNPETISRLTRSIRSSANREPLFSTNSLETSKDEVKKSSTDNGAFDEDSEEKEARKL